MKMVKLTKDERLVFDHLAREDVTPKGSVEGDAFRRLVSLGLVEVEGDRTFLSEYGWEARSDEHMDQRDAEFLSQLDEA